MDGRFGVFSPIQLAMNLKRMDIAQQLVKAGANPIHPSLDRVYDVPQLLTEFYEFGTNQYIAWLLHEHLPLNERPNFIKTVVELDICNEASMRLFNGVGRHPAHALLTSGSEEMIMQFLDKPGPSGANLLTVKDSTQRTALQIATKKGDLESVDILLKLYR